MSLSLSQLFEQHKSENSSEPKKEEPRELDDDENRSNGIGDGPTSHLLVDSEQSETIERNSVKTNPTRKSKKRERSPLPPRRNSDGENGGLKEQLVVTKRIKTESSNDIKKEKDEQMERDILDTEYYGEDEYDEEDGVVESISNQKFYQNYSESVKVLYNSQADDSEQRNHSEVLEVLHSALFPTKNNFDGSDRRLPGDYGNEGEDDAYPSRSLTGRYRPRKRRVVTKLPSGKKHISYRLETQEEIQDRVHRMEGYDERSALRTRWKSRSVNFQSEEDIGDAFLLRAQQNIGEKLRADEKERRMKERKERKEGLKKRKKEELEKLKELESGDFLEEDDEVKEQSQLLAQLSQKDTLLKEEGEDSVPLKDPASNESSRKLNYWELGYTMPKKGSISFDFDPSVEKMVQSGSKEALETGSKDVIDNHETNNETKASFSALMKKQNGKRHSSRYFFEPNRTLVSNGNNTFRPGYRSGHIHHMLSMAARSLCGDGGGGSKDDIALENHYLRLLCKQDEDSAKRKRSFGSTICADFRKKGYLTTFSEDQGANMLLFLQNTWNDPTEVAKQLGISDGLQESPIRGNLLTNMKAHFKNIRSQIKKSHKIRSINWSHNKYDDDKESNHEDFDEEAIAPSDGKMIADITTNDGVVDALTMETSLTIDKKKNFAPSNDARDALVSPTTLYSHIAGTTPPIPQHPLDPTSLMFGPVDRYSKFYHVGVRMDSSIFKVVLSTLLKRMSRARISNNQNVLLDTQDQILNLIEEFANVNENKFYLQYNSIIQDPLDSDIPLVEFYRGVNEYCTYMANGYIEVQQPNEPLDGPEIKRDENDSPHALSGMNLTAGKIWEFCRPKIRQNPLVRFPKLRIIFGVALICRNLNPSAAEILSRPIDNDGICTPLDLFKATLEDMETKKFIVTNQNFEVNSIRAAELEFLLHDASEFFQEAVELDPTNIEYHLWHIGCLASCLLISSGNKISASSVHVHPSQMRGTFMNQETVAHELRPCMKKYKEVRIELSTAVKALFTLAKYQDSPKAHFAVFSLLEWGQVIGLLVGSQLNEFLNDINKRHAFHFGVWAHHEPVTFLREYKGITEDICAPSLFAQILENHPEEISNWRNFVLCLGPISTARSHNWWGEDRMWWGDSLLHIFSPNACNHMRTKADHSIAKKVIEKLREVISTSPIVTHSSSMMNKIENDSENAKNDEEIDWLPSSESVVVQNDEQVNISKEERTRCYANDLPTTKRNTSSGKDDNASAFLSSILIPSSENCLLQDLSSLSHEVQAYKIFISCHLFGLDHPSVRKSIYYNLYCNCVGNETLDENCDEFRVLVWLSSMGIDVEHVIKIVESN